MTPFPTLTLLAGLLLIGGCGSWLPEGGPVDCIAVADEAVPVPVNDDHRAQWSAAFRDCKRGGQ